MKDNIIGKIQLILCNMPSDCSDLEKVRYIYMKLGNIFCYDFRIIMDESLAGIALDYDNINKYQTCTQISEILKIVLDKFNNNAEAKIIERPSLKENKYTKPHVAVGLKFTDTVTGIDYNLLLDLTLDLFRIQAGLQTKQFGYTTDAIGSYDIISLKECEEMDHHLNLIDENGYKEKKIDEVKNYLTLTEMTLKDKITYMWQKLSVNFLGAHEARQYIEFLLWYVFPNVNSKSYNFYHGDENNEEFETLFIIKDEEENKDIYMLFDNRIGLLLSSKENVESMLKAGWKTNSLSLSKIVGYDIDNTKNL